MKFLTRLLFKEAEIKLQNLTDCLNDEYSKYGVKVN